MEDFDNTFTNSMGDFDNAFTSREQFLITVQEVRLINISNHSSKYIYS